MASRVELTVQVRHLSNKVTEADLTTFFSYCGTIKEIKLQRDGDQWQLAFVTFSQPYAQKTALLLNDAIVLDNRVCITPLDSSRSPPSKNNKSQNEKPSFPQAALPVMQASDYKELQNAAQELDKKLRTSDTSNSLSATALWLSGMLDKVAKCIAELGTTMDREMNSRKQI